MPVYLPSGANYTPALQAQAEGGGFRGMVEGVQLGDQLVNSALLREQRIRMMEAQAREEQRLLDDRSVEEMVGLGSPAPADGGGGGSAATRAAGGSAVGGPGLGMDPRAAHETSLGGMMDTWDQNRSDRERILDYADQFEMDPTAPAPAGLRVSPEQQAAIAAWMKQEEEKALGLQMQNEIVQGVLQDQYVDNADPTTVMSDQDAIRHRELIDANEAELGQRGLQKSRAAMGGFLQGQADKIDAGPGEGPEPEARGALPSQFAVWLRGQPGTTEEKQQRFLDYKSWWDRAAGLQAEARAGAQAEELDIQIEEAGETIALQAPRQDGQEWSPEHKRILGRVALTHGMDKAQRVADNLGQTQRTRITDKGATKRSWMPHGERRRREQLREDALVAAELEGNADIVRERLDEVDQITEDLQARRDAFEKAGVPWTMEYEQPYLDRRKQAEDDVSELIRRSALAEAGGARTRAAGVATDEATYRKAIEPPKPPPPSRTGSWTPERLKLEYDKLQFRQDQLDTQEEGKDRRLGAKEGGKDRRLGAKEGGKDRRLGVTEQGKGDRQVTGILADEAQLQFKEDRKDARLDTTEAGKDRRQGKDLEARDRRQQLTEEGKDSRQTAQILHVEEVFKATEEGRNRRAELRERGLDERQTADILSDEAQLRYREDRRDARDQAARDWEAGRTAAAGEALRPVIEVAVARAGFEGRGAEDITTAVTEHYKMGGRDPSRIVELFEAPEEDLEDLIMAKYMGVDVAELRGRSQGSRQPTGGGRGGRTLMPATRGELKADGWVDQGGGVWKKAGKTPLIEGRHITVSD